MLSRKNQGSTNAALYICQRSSLSAPLYALGRLIRKREEGSRKWEGVLKAGITWGWWEITPSIVEVTEAPWAGQSLGSSQMKAKRQHLLGPLPQSYAAQLSDPWAPGASATVHLMGSLPDFSAMCQGYYSLHKLVFELRKKLLSSLGMDKHKRYEQE